MANITVLDDQIKKFILFGLIIETKKFSLIDQINLLPQFA